MGETALLTVSVPRERLVKHKQNYIGKKKWFVKVSETTRHFNIYLSHTNPYNLKVTEAQKGHARCDINCSEKKKTLGGKNARYEIEKYEMRDRKCEMRDRKM